MFNFNNNSDDIAKLLERIESLEKRIAMLEEQIEELKKVPVKEEKKMEPEFIAQLSSIIPNAKPADNRPSESVFYFAAPSANGDFAQVSPREQIGKSIYKLVTEDNMNGHFVMLDTPDAIATAMISTSQFIKPACKVVGDTSKYPRRIVTEEEGAATFQAGMWRVSRKAVVRFE